MGAFSDLFHGRNDYDIVGRRRTWATVSAAILAVSVTALAFGGLNLGIDFKGGTIWTLSYAASGEGGGEATGTAPAAPVAVSGVRPSEGAVRDAVARGGASADKILFIGQSQVEVESAEADSASANAVQRELAVLAGVPADKAGEIVSVSAVGATWGAQISKKALQALVAFLIVVSIYITWRFEWQMAVAALVELIHDLVITLGVYALFRHWLVVTPATVIATLTIIGYTLYDSVVVFDRVKENSTSPWGARAPYDQMVNRSLNQVVMRSLNTSLSTLLPVSALMFAGFFLGAATLRDFAVALFVGILAGTYSSIFVTAPMLVYLGKPGAPPVPSARSGSRSRPAKTREDDAGERRSKPKPKALAAPRAKARREEEPDEEEPDEEDEFDEEEDLDEFEEEEEATEARRPAKAPAGAKAGGKSSGGAAKKPAGGGKAGQKKGGKGRTKGPSGGKGKSKKRKRR